MESRKERNKKVERQAVAFYLLACSLAMGLPGALFIYLTSTYA